MCLLLPRGCLLVAAAWPAWKEGHHSWYKSQGILPCTFNAESAWLHVLELQPDLTAHVIQHGIWRLCRHHDRGPACMLSQTGCYEEVSFVA